MTGFLVMTLPARLSGMVLFLSSLGYLISSPLLHPSPSHLQTGPCFPVLPVAGFGGGSQPLVLLLHLLRWFSDKSKNLASVWAQRFLDLFLIEEGKKTVQLFPAAILNPGCSLKCLSSGALDPTKIN